MAYTKEELQKARAWFQKFGELLKANGIDLNNPYALGLVGITCKLPLPDVNGDTASPEEIAEAIESLNDGEVYAFMERDENGAYRTPRPANGKSGQWVRDNMKTFAEVEASDDHVMNLFKMAQEGRLYVSEAKTGGDAHVAHNHVYADKDGNLHLTRDFESLVDDLHGIVYETEEAQKVLDALNQEEELARRGKKMGTLPLTEEEVQQLTEQRETLREETARMETAYNKGEYPDGRKIPVEQLAAEKEKMQTNYRTMHKMSKMISSKEKPAEVDLEEDPQVLLAQIREKKPAAQRALSEAKNKTFKYLQQGLTPEQFQQIRQIQEISRGQTLTIGSLRTAASNKRKAAIFRAERRKQPEIGINARREYRTAVYGKDLKQEERNLCVLGSSYPDWVERLGADRTLEIQKLGALPEEDWTPEEKEVAEDRFFTSSAFEDIKKSLLSKTKLPSLKAVAASGRVFRTDGTQYPTDTFDFMKAVVADNQNGNGIGIRYEKNGKTRADVFLTNSDMGLMKAYNVDQYRKAFNALTEELLATDSRFSKGSESYKKLRKEVLDLQKEMNATSDKFVNHGLLSNIISCCEKYQLEHKDVNPLSDRQQRRLDVMNRLRSLEDMMNDDNTFCEVKECKASFVADRILHAQALSMQKKKETAAEGCRLQLDRDFFKANKKHLMDNPVFKKMIDLAAEDGKLLDKMVSMDGAKLVKGMNKLGSQMMDAPTAEAVKNQNYKLSL